MRWTSSRTAAVSRAVNIWMQCTLCVFALELSFFTVSAWNWTVVVVDGTKRAARTRLA
jgi:hypothetical protein